ncbi:hypothetical protein [Microbacterium sp. WCS2018Hpa-23]|uniref:hypothetical protein n=1 Tax=Microbacterium sp. WCS2018Hpa-23 TaxID=3073634 RepID=UPI002882EA28|nr:hypothetical protein [Microbacterium sp. WCS2018Hpa-23]
MSHEHAKDSRSLPMDRSMGREGRERIVREALERIDGAPTPAVDMMQAAMGSEAQIRLVHDVVRAYLDEHDLADAKAWAAALREQTTDHDASVSVI